MSASHHISPSHWPCAIQFLWYNNLIFHSISLQLIPFNDEWSLEFTQLHNMSFTQSLIVLSSCCIQHPWSISLHQKPLKLSVIHSISVLIQSQIAYLPVWSWSIVKYQRRTFSWYMILVYVALCAIKPHPPFTTDRI